MDLDIKAILNNEVPQFRRVLLQFLAGVDVIKQRGAKKLDILR